VTNARRSWPIAVCSIYRSTLPPHYPDDRKTYLISAACFEHRAFMADEERRELFAADLLGTLAEQAGGEIRAWVVLPNHYHVLVTLDLKRIMTPLRLLHSSSATRWNKEDCTPRRKVWYRYTDRRIRNGAHFWASFNYVHANPAKHGYVAKADAWAHSSLRDHLEEHGRARLVELWNTYPVLNYGDGWDD
jgi:putative transposase